MEAYLNPTVSSVTNNLNTNCVRRTYSELLELPEPEATPNVTDALKDLVDSTVGCFLAHWYFLPGLSVQRHRVRLIASSILGLSSPSRAALLKLLRRQPGPTCYFDFDFAWRALSSRESLGDYLDVSSTLSFPLVLLSRRRADTATLVTKETHAESLLAGFAFQNHDGLRFRNSTPDTLTPNSFDVVTSLAWVGKTADDVGAIASLWGSLKPGGTLLLSVPCAAAALEEYSSNQQSSSGNSSSSGVFVRRLYDIQLLNTRIFDRLGQPKSFTVYGELTPGSYKNYLLRAGNRTSLHWRDPLIIGQDWRCYSSIEDLPGEGIIAMKFVKPLTASDESVNRVAR